MFEEIYKINKYRFIVYYIFSPFIIVGLIYLSKHTFSKLNNIEYSNITRYFLIFIPIFIFISLFIIFHTLILIKEIYNEGYVDTLINNWKKNPIMDIEINNLNKINKIGFFKNFKDEQSTDIYKWKNKTFNFKRMEREYNYTKILQNENKYSKKCGKDNLGNYLYFNKEEECPINYIEITNNTYPSLKSYENYTWKNISIDNYYLFYTNKYFEGEILIDLKVSNYLGPCLNNKQNNEICTFYLEKCDLNEKNYVCDAYTNNTFKIDNESIIDLIKENNLTSTKHYDYTSSVYLYNETYIGFSNYNIDNLIQLSKRSKEMFNIKQFIHKTNIVLFIYMILFLIGIILYFVIKELKNWQKLLKLLLYIIYFILTIICFILLLISVIKHFIISKDISQLLNNEFSDFYKNTNWQIYLKITLLIFYFMIMIFIFIKLFYQIKWYYKNYLIKENTFPSLNKLGNKTETESFKNKENLIKELKELIDIEKELKNKIDENEKVKKREKEKKIKTFEDLTVNNYQIKETYDDLKNEINNINEKINNLKKEKNKIINFLNNNFDDLENEIINLENDILKEKEKRKDIKEIYDVYNKDFMDLRDIRNNQH